MLHLESAPPPLADVLGAPVDRLLEGVVATCLQKDPAARFQSAADLFTLLARCSNVGQAVVAPHASVAVPAPPIHSAVSARLTTQLDELRDGPMIAAELERIHGQWRAHFAWLLENHVRAPIPERVAQLVASLDEVGVRLSGHVAQVDALVQDAQPALGEARGEEARTRQLLVEVSAQLAFADTAPVASPAAGDADDYDDVPTTIQEREPAPAALPPGRGRSALGGGTARGDEDAIERRELEQKRRQVELSLAVSERRLGVQQRIHAMQMSRAVSQLRAENRLLQNLHRQAIEALRPFAQRVLELRPAIEALAKIDATVAELDQLLDAQEGV
jgi:hypothetical protein